MDNYTKHNNVPRSDFFLDDVWSEDAIFYFSLLEDATHLLNNMEDGHAYTEDSNHWNYFIVPQMKYHRETKLIRLPNNTGSMFLTFYLDNSKLHLKDTLNKFILRLKDVGLYKHYTDLVYLESKQLGLVTYKHIPKPPRVRILTLRYFTFIFMAWFVGIVISFVVLIIENLIFCNDISKIISK